MALTGRAATAHAQQARADEQAGGLLDGARRPVEPAAAANGETDTKDESASMSGRERLLLERIEVLERRLSELEEKMNRDEAASLPLDARRAETPTARRNTTDKAAPALTSAAKIALSPQISNEDRSILDFFRDTTINFTIDGYYGYNFNRPAGGINLLRAYDVMSNSFSLNQAAIIIERAPDVEAGRRFGARLDLQFGQATETVQGNTANEPRPQVYRPVWQAYGTYVAPVGKGLTVDFGKFAGALGYETNYTKDNFNYSRSYFFNFLPFYHFGFRSTYAFNGKFTLAHWLVNGIQQSEDFNGFKSQALLLTWRPGPRITSQFNYYNGQEQRDRRPDPNPTFAPVASQPGLSIDVIRPVPSGRLHVLDSYATFNVSDKLTLAFEGDYVIGRVERSSAPAVVAGGAGYARYQFAPRFALAGRFEYLGEKVSDRGGLFTGVRQALKESTLTAEYRFGEGFLGRLEYRRDFSNQPFFLTERPGILKKEQNTATLGLVWWFGRKQDAW
jgi:hypothetical protein